MCFYLGKGNCYHGIGASMLGSSYATAVEHNTFCTTTCLYYYKNKLAVVTTKQLEIS